MLMTWGSVTLERITLILKSRRHIWTNWHRKGCAYDLVADIRQSNNLYEQKPEKVKELKSLLNVLQAKGQVR